MLLKVNQSRAEMEARVSRVAARAGLTIGQTRVVAILAEGFSNRGIAATLGLSVRTVETHLVAVFDKLGVASRAAALAVLLEEPNHASPKMEP